MINQQENMDVLNYYLNRRLFNESGSLDYLAFNLPEKIENFPAGRGIELIIRPECNQKCEYCYIGKYGDMLYPHKERGDNQYLLQNLRTLLDFIWNHKKIYVPRWELFAGDLFYDNFYFDILDVFYEYLSAAYQEYSSVFKKYGGLILTPCNFSFILNDDKAQKVEEYINKFAELNWELGFSVSTDGLPAIETREGTIQDNYYEKVFEFIHKHPAVGIHAMIAPSNVHKCIENYDWWRRQYEQNFDINKTSYIPYFLEVRNGFEWNRGKIGQYIKALDHMIEDAIALCGGDIDAFTDLLLDKHPHYSIGSYYPFSITIPDYKQAQEMACSLGKLECINLSTLELVPCHRLSYKQFRGAQLKCENNDYSLVPGNVEGYLGIKLSSPQHFPHCANCVFSPLCKKGCLGAQYEASGEVFTSIDSVCLLEKWSIGYIVHKYAALGVFNSAFHRGLLSQELYETYNHIDVFYVENMESEVLAYVG